MTTGPLERLLRLWTEPLGEQGEAERAFRDVYADPVVVNGTPTPVEQLVVRARTLQAAFDGLRADVLDEVETEDRIVVAFHLRGRHTGTFPSPLGDVPPTGQDVQVRTIDVLTIEAGRVTRIWVVADDLGLLSQLGAVRRT
jgi:predicted ester cyclase